MDGDPTTRWSSLFQDNQWWQVDLGSAKTVDMVTLNWEAAYASQYKIQTSTDGTTFTTQATVNDTASGLKSTSFPAVSARYVRILGVTRATPYGITSNVVYPPVTDTGWVTDSVRDFVASSREHFNVAQPHPVSPF